MQNSSTVHLGSFESSQEKTASESISLYSYAAVVAAVADSSYIETDDAQGGTNIVLDVANQPVKHQNKMLVIILGIGILAVGIIAGLAIKRKQRK